MQHPIRKHGEAEAPDNKFDRTPDPSLGESEWAEEEASRLDDEDPIKHHISEEEADTIEWEDEEDTRNMQGVDKAPGEETGKGEKVTKKDLKGKQVDADPSTKKGKPLGH